MNIGKMKHRITIEKYQESFNELGEITKEWTPFKVIWAEKKRLRANNINTEKKEGINYLYRFKIRNRKDIDESMRVIHKDIIYDIKHINNIHEVDMYETHLDCMYHKEGAFNE